MLLSNFLVIASVAIAAPLQGVPLLEAVTDSDISMASVISLFNTTDPSSSTLVKRDGNYWSFIVDHTEDCTCDTPPDNPGHCSGFAAWWSQAHFDYFQAPDNSMFISDQTWDVQHKSMSLRLPTGTKLTVGPEDPDSPGMLPMSYGDCKWNGGYDDTVGNGPKGCGGCLLINKEQDASKNFNGPMFCLGPKHRVRRLFCEFNA